MKKTYIIALIAVLISGGTVAAIAQESGSPEGVAPAPYNYAAKFACGEFDKFRDPTPQEVPEGPVKPGDYQTVINVHNPNSTAVSFRKKAVVLYAGKGAFNQTSFEVPRGPGQILTATLNPDWGLFIDCQDIRKKLLGNVTGFAAPLFIDGWVVILSSLPLDIDAVYTGVSFNRTTSTSGAVAVTREGFSFEVRRILPTAGVQ